MTDNVVSIKPSMNAAEALRNIADDIDSGLFDGESVTVISIPDVFQLGPVSNSDAATEAVFNCTFAIHKLIGAASNVE